MNIFYLDTLPYLAAMYLCDKHVIKMAVESAQILSTVHSICGTWNPEMYKPTHTGHPCVHWAATARDNYIWVLDHLDGLLSEYSYRYGRKHKTAERFKCLMNYPNILETAHTAPPQVMPQQYRGADTVAAYRAYYLAEKAHFARWTRREPPPWWDK